MLKTIGEKHSPDERLVVLKCILRCPCPILWLLFMPIEVSDDPYIFTAQLYLFQ